MRLSGKKAQRCCAENCLSISNCVDECCAGPGEFPTNRLIDNAKHTLLLCARWGVARKAVGQAVGAQLTPDTMVSLMLQSEQIWMLIELSFYSCPGWLG